MLDFIHVEDHAFHYEDIYHRRTKIELERLHDSSRDKHEHVCDRIKAVLLASEGWSSVMIAQALRLHQTTVDRHISDYVNNRKLKPENGGSEGMLSAEQT